jgi:hypothetical protein
LDADISNRGASSLAAVTLRLPPATFRDKPFPPRQTAKASPGYTGLIIHLIEGNLIMTKKFAAQSSFYALFASAMIFASAGAASAQSLERLAEADANSDGNITWQEMLDIRAGMFQRLDRNGDGVVDANDSPRMGPGKAKFQEAFEKMSEFDTNGDGKITSAEMRAAPAPLFEAGDTNGDQVLSADEMAALRAQAPVQR